MCGFGDLLVLPKGFLLPARPEPNPPPPPKPPEPPPRVCLPAPPAVRWPPNRPPCCCFGCGWCLMSMLPKAGERLPSNSLRAGGQSESLHVCKLGQQARRLGRHGKAHPPGATTQVAWQRLPQATLAPHEHGATIALEEPAGWGGARGALSEHCVVRMEQSKLGQCTHTRRSLPVQHLASTAGVLWARTLLLAGLVCGLVKPGGGGETKTQFVSGNETRGQCPIYVKTRLVFPVQINNHGQ